MSRARRHEQRWRGWRVLGWASVLMSVILVATSLTAYGKYRSLLGNITHEDVSGQLGNTRPPKLNKAKNILLIGSDTRTGKNAKYGKDEGARSDTIMLLHLSPGGKKATGISFPRDSMVQLPDCKKRDGTNIPAHLGMINESFNNGGAGCTWRAIESLTKIRIDHFIQVDFSGFKRVVDALDGVEICLRKPVRDPKSHLRLSAGKHTVKGETALAYVRTRYNLGDGSDLSRIKRQQKFMGSVVKKASETSLLTDPRKLYGFLDAATKSVTTDKDMTVDVMRELADGVKGMSAGKVRFVTVPWQAYPGDPNRIQFSPAAEQLFAAIRSDNALEDQASQQNKPKVPPSSVRVRVLNASGTPGLARRVADQLEAKGFQVGKVGNAPVQSARTQVVFASGADQQGATLASFVQGVRPVPRQDGPAGTADLLIGSQWSGLKDVGQTRIPGTISQVKGSDNICKDA